jgi:hypothetical protein
MTSKKREYSLLEGNVSSSRNYWEKAALGRLSLTFLATSNDFAGSIDYTLTLTLGNIFGKKSFITMCNERAVDMVHPDMTSASGIMESKSWDQTWDWLPYHMTVKS